jgi:hypothetical protein
MKFAQYATIVAAIHTFIVALHGLAHQKIPVPLSFFQSLFVDTVIVLAPLMAISLLWTPFARASRWLFLSSMTLALLFGIYNHFIIITPDHLSQIPFDGWGVLFQVTAILLLITEAIGCGVGIWALNPLQQKTL